MQGALLAAAGEAGGRGDLGQFGHDLGRFGLILASVFAGFLSPLKQLSIFRVGKSPVINLD